MRQERQRILVTGAAGFEPDRCGTTISLRSIGRLL
jgi:ribosomal protein S6E (S10)